MSKENKSGVIKPAKALASVNSASGKPPLIKRPNSEVANTTAEEMTILSHQMECMNEDLKLIRENLTSILKKKGNGGFYKKKLSPQLSQI